MADIIKHINMRAEMKQKWLDWELEEQAKAKAQREKERKEDKQALIGLLLIVGLVIIGGFVEGI
jgi:hypothetical protein